MVTLRGSMWHVEKTSVLSLKGGMFMVSIPSGESVFDNFPTNLVFNISAPFW